MKLKMANYARDLLQDFKPNLILLNEIIYVNATVISLVTITNEIGLSNSNGNQGYKNK